MVYEIKDGKGFLPESKFAEYRFEGEIINGIKTGIGKEFNYSNGSLEYEGEYLPKTLITFSLKKKKELIKVNMLIYPKKNKIKLYEYVLSKIFFDRSVK